MSSFEFGYVDSPRADIDDEKVFEMVTEFLDESCELNRVMSLEIKVDDTEMKNKLDFSEFGTNEEMEIDTLRNELEGPNEIESRKNEEMEMDTLKNELEGPNKMISVEPQNDSIGNCNKSNEILYGNKKIKKRKKVNKLKECTLPKDRELRKRILGNLCKQLKLNDFEKREAKYGTQRSFSSFFNDPKIEERKAILQTLLDSSIDIDDLMTTELRETVQSLEKHSFIDEMATQLSRKWLNMMAREDDAKIIVHMNLSTSEMVGKVHDFGNFTTDLDSEDVRRKDPPELVSIIFSQDKKIRVIVRVLRFKTIRQIKRKIWNLENIPII